MNDPFVKRNILSVGYLYRPDRLGLFLNVGYSPDLGEADWRPLTTQLINENSVSPDISRILMYGSAKMLVPLTTIADNMNRLDMSALGGMGLVQTSDDLSALDAIGDARAESTQFQWHPSINFGVQFRFYRENGAIPFGILASVERMSFIETVNATTLEMKSNSLISLGLEFGGRP